MYEIERNLEKQQSKLFKLDINEFNDIKDFNERRNSLRMTIVNIFGEEEPSIKDKEIKKYSYIVDEIKNNDKIFQLTIERPAFNYKGFDFTVNINRNDDKYLFTNNRGKETSRPSHNDIKLDIIKKYKHSKEIYFWLIEKIRKIYYIENIDYNDVRKKQKNLEDLDEDLGLNLEVLLKTIQWLFIEQDIRYWDGQGRKYIYNFFVAPIFEINKNNNVIEIKHYKNEEKCDFIKTACCNKDFQFDELFYYSEKYFEKLKRNMYMQKEMDNSYIKWNPQNLTNTDINLLERGVKQILGFGNAIWIYTMDNNSLINDINGILVNDNDFTELLNYVKENNCIIILKEY